MLEKENPQVTRRYHFPEHCWMCVTRHLSKVSVIFGCIVLAGLYGNVLIFCVLQIMCQIAYLKFWQKNVRSCRGPWLRAFQWVNLFPERCPDNCGQRWPPSHGISVWCERCIVGPASTMWLTPRHSLQYLHWGASLALLHMLFHRVPSNSIGRNWANVSLFVAFFNSDQHFQVLSYAAVFLGMVCVGSLDSNRAYHPLGIEKRCWECQLHILGNNGLGWQCRVFQRQLWCDTIY